MTISLGLNFGYILLSHLAHGGQLCYVSLKSSEISQMSLDVTPPEVNNKAVLEGG